MLLTAALTSLALLVPVNVPSTIEVTRTTTREGDTLYTEERVSYESGSFGSHSTTTCGFTVRELLCQVDESIPDMQSTTAITRGDGTIEITSESHFENGETVQSDTTVYCDGGSATAAAVCDVYDLIEAIDQES